MAVRPRLTTGTSRTGAVGSPKPMRRARQRSTRSRASSSRRRTRRGGRTRRGARRNRAAGGGSCRPRRRFRCPGGRARARGSRAGTGRARGAPASVSFCTSTSRAGPVSAKATRGLRQASKRRRSSSPSSNTATACQAQPRAGGGAAVERHAQGGPRRQHAVAEPVRPALPVVRGVEVEFPQDAVGVVGHHRLARGRGGRAAAWRRPSSPSDCAAAGAASASSSHASMTCSIGTTPFFARNMEVGNRRLQVRGVPSAQRCRPVRRSGHSEQDGKRHLPDEAIVLRYKPCWPASRKAWRCRCARGRPPPPRRRRSRPRPGLPSGW